MKSVALATHRISGVSFEPLTDEEILRMSVKQITKPYSFDNLNHPVSEGLYDLALGPIDQHASCETCGEKFNACPGHIGHISLPVPVYNPITFMIMCNILGSLCFNCNRLRQKPQTV
eukprot:TRINITY_DN15320_c0_g1_i1.p1 TRINITY_DN15320_c0_g1~~TRINITY_DN15320_c0_g1_i1.p1  ORF type:complete len:117 (+),score=10.93 TRINITY_DN15320_c0_g1_i1:48-398(+)